MNRLIFGKQAYSDTDGGEAAALFTRKFDTPAIGIVRYT